MFSNTEAFTQSGFTPAPGREGPHVVDGGIDRHPQRFGYDELADWSG